MLLIGFKTNTGQEFTPDKSLAISTTPTMLQAKFGDGYEQRARKGINSLESSYSVTFSNRTLAEAKQLSEFFDEVLGVTSFDFSLPDSSLNTYKVVKVVCDDYSRTMEYNNYHTVTATFRRVYN